MDLNLQQHYPLIAAFILICVLINVVPLLPFIKPLSKARIKGIHDYHALAARHQQAFDDRWMEHPEKFAELVGHPDISSTSDILMVYEAARSMTVIPFNIKTLLTTVIIAVLPLLPVFALQVPIVEILKMLAGILL